MELTLQVEPSLLPNATECQDLIVAFYDLISSPNSENLTNATDLFSEDFSYSQVRSTSSFLNYGFTRQDSAHTRSLWGCCMLRATPRGTHIL